MDASPRKAREVFLAAIKLPAEEREAYLREACGDHQDLHQRVSALLQAQAEIGSYYEPPDHTVYQPVSESAGTVIGPYKLIEQIGEGGMGTVWMAQQTEPVKRVVALKLIKAGMDSRQVIARFEAERQALALMDHANIARVLDAGTTIAGRPYFVMDLVKGVPITKYCDEHHLTPRQRLELFIPVCQAVQHAHQKGIIHRDLKPSNVLVALYDGKPVPKVIDFGVAKAAGQALTDKTLVTGFGNIVGTLEYMSPEQAEVNQLDIDTRSDIYSLGVVLYELLTGSPPFSRKELEKAGMLEMLRVIREQEPSKPSMKLSSSDALPSLSANRGTEPAKLTRLVRGELDWIVMKALEKDRNRRYETANGFAMDVERYLADEAVQACPPSAAYRFRKFARRNKAPMGAAAVALLFLVTIASGIGWLVRDRASRQTRLAGQLEVILDEAERLMGQQKWPEALAAAQRAEPLIAGGEADEETRQHAEEVLADLNLVQRLEQARLLASQVSEGKFNRAGAEQAYARAFADAGLTVEGVTVEEAAGQCRSRRAIRTELASALMDRAWLRRKLAEENDDAGWRHLLAVADAIDADPWRRRLREVWGRKDGGAETLRELADAADVRTLPSSSLRLLGLVLRDRVSHDEAAKLLLRAQQHRPDEFSINFDLAGCLAQSTPEQLDEAVTYYRVADALRPGNAAVHNNLGIVFGDQKKWGQAIACFRRAIDLDPKIAVGHNNLGIVLGDQKRFDEAIACYRRAIELDPKGAAAHHNLGNVLRHQKRWDEAIACYREAIELDSRFAGAYVNLGLTLYKQDKLDEAIASCRKAIGLDSKNVRAHVGLGVGLHRQGKLVEAIACYRRAIELDPKDAEAHLDLGNALREQKNLDEAIASYNMALDLDPNDAFAHNGLGAALIDQEKPEEASASFRRAIEIAPENTAFHRNLGNVLVGQKKFDEASACFRRAIELAPLNAAGHIHLGVVLRKQNKLDEAIASFRKGIELDPKQAWAYSNLGGVLCEQRKPDEAITSCRKAIELDPNHAAAYHNLGWAFALQAKLDDAIGCFQKAIELDPRSAQSHNNLGLALKDQDKLDEAIACWRRVIELDPKHANAYKHLGDVLKELGKLDDAVDAYRKAIELEPKNLSCHDNLAIALATQGHLEEAIQSQRKAIELDPHNATRLNNLAWRLATATDIKLRRPAEAVELAAQAVKLSPEKWAHWNTFSIACYRSGAWQEALDARQQAIQRRDQGGAFCWNGLSLATIRWQLGQKEEARTAYERVAQEAKKHSYLEDYLRETQQLLGITPEAPKAENR